MAKQKIYIAGCGGMLGDAFYKVFSDEYEVRCTDIDVNSTWLSYMDFRDLKSYAEDVRNFSPDFLFHLGAYTDLEYCERHADDTYKTNTLSVENATYIANALNIPILYISTAGIFDGSKDVFDDWDRPNPLGHYARSKYAGEVFVQNAVQRHLIVRAGWMMGGGPAKDKKFVQKLALQIKNGAKVLNIVNDKLGTPTYTFDFANNAKALLENQCWGLYNMVCGGVTGRMEVAREMIKILKLETKVGINEVDSSFFAAEYFAERPPSERLINKKLQLRGMDGMRDWRVCLEEYLHEHYRDYLG